MSNFDWKAELQHWLCANSDVPTELAASVVIFFERAFKHARCPTRAWFGLHREAASLVVGGIYLAAIQCSGQDKGFWLLLDDSTLKLDGVTYQPVKSTRKSKHPLIWAHCAVLKPIPDLVATPQIWDSFSRASQKILESAIANDRDAVQIRRKKRRLIEFLICDSPEAAEKNFADAVRSSMRDDAETRRKRLAQASIIPKKMEIKAFAFARNPDVVAEVLLRAKGHCEVCGNPAPFIRRSDNSPYLEVHHTTPLALGGKDTVEEALALCPNCHRKAHYG